MIPQETPFHDGELAIQDKLGVRQSVASYAPRVIRPYMPDQHREFYEALLYFFIGTVDENGSPWASIVWGEQGFISSSDPMSLTVRNLPLEKDPLFSALKKGQEVGMLGLQFHSRRRNRVNGRIQSTNDSEFTIAITQSFGNCPQYIQGREASLRDMQSQKNVHSETRAKLAEPDQALIRSADTFFIASASGSLGITERHGVDMSHRGGKPGFVKILANGSLLIPDFSGNNHFNTLGNIHVNPLAGLLFIDFETGDILQLTGKAQIVWPDDTEHTYEGALRYLLVTPQKVIRHTAALPFRWSATQVSPYLPATEGWKTKKPELKAAQNTQTYKVVGILDEATDVKSIFLKPTGIVSASYKPGQHLPIQVSINGKTHHRTYTLSAAPGKSAYRITVKRDLKGIVSNYLHTQLTVGDQIVARPPSGNFFLRAKENRPIVLLSAGIGITPMTAMAEALLPKSESRSIYFIHGNRRLADVPFVKDLQRWELENPNFDLSLILSSEEKAQQGSLFGKGHVDTQWLTAKNLPVSAEYYLCGPSSFMQTSYDWLLSKGISKNDIHFEEFGPSTVNIGEVTAANSLPDATVSFQRSQKTVTWKASKETLLEVAEGLGIEAAFSCRSGSCGSCAVQIKGGKVNHPPSTTFLPATDEILLCCAEPLPDEKDTTIVIDL